MKRLLPLLPVFVIVGCSASAPDDVELTVKPGVCVTSAYLGYEATSSNISPYYSFPLNAYTGESSPYCMALTLTNNNSGQNSNNVQVYQGGLSLSYSVESNTFIGYMIDYNAAGISPGYFNYRTYQILGNMALFDPQNCVTTQGVKVNTLHKNGGSCTFYLQLIDESMPVGIYPLNVNINYTNGNDNYSVGTTIYQQVGILAGGEFSQPGNKLAVYDGNNQFIAEPLSVDLPNLPSVKLLARDVIGNVYAYDGSDVYQYNGISLVKTQNTPESINDLSGDRFGNLFAATQNGLYVYNASVNGSNTWGLVSGVPSMQVNAVRAESANAQNIVFITGANGVESCIFTNGSCNGISQLFTGNQFNNQALAVNAYESQIVWGSESGLFNGATSPLTTGEFAINQQGKIGLDKLGLIYVGSESDEFNPAVFSNLGNLTGLSPLQDYENNVLFGKSNGVYLRSTDFKTSSIMSLYTYGQNLSSLVPFSDQYLVLLSMAVAQNGINYYAAKSNWTAITGFNGLVNDIVISSRLSIESNF